MIVTLNMEEKVRHNFNTEWEIIGIIAAPKDNKKEKCDIITTAEKRVK